MLDEEALLTALAERTIAGAGLDVFATEPALDARFLGMQHVVLAPHSASITEATRAALIGVAVAMPGGCPMQNIKGTTLARCAGFWRAPV